MIESQPGAEKHHWINWRKNIHAKSGGAVIMGPLIDLFQPSHEVIVEERERQETDAVQSESGGPQNPVTFSSRGEEEGNIPAAVADSLWMDTAHAISVTYEVEDGERKDSKRS